MSTQVDMFPGSVSKSMVVPWNWATFTLLLWVGFSLWVKAISPLPLEQRGKPCKTNVIGLVLISN